MHFDITSTFCKFELFCMFKYSKVFFVVSNADISVKLQLYAINLYILELSIPVKLVRFELR